MSASILRPARQRGISRGGPVFRAVSETLGEGIRVHCTYTKAIVLLLLLPAGCTLITPGMSRMVQDGDRSHGVTYYVGGAGQVGNAVGAMSVPEGMQDAGYHGFVEVYPWQTITPALDQVAIEHNRSKGADLAELI